MFHDWPALMWGAYFLTMVAIFLGVGYFLGAYTDYPPFRKGANWKGQKPKTLWSQVMGLAEMNEIRSLVGAPRKNVKSSYHSKLQYTPEEARAWVLMSRYDWKDAKVYTEPMKEKSMGVMLTKNGEQHTCNTPTFKWTRGADLKNVWMCECGKRYRLKAELLSERDKVDARDVVSYYDKEALDAMSTERKRLSLLDILKIGNVPVSPRPLWMSPGDSYTVLSSEEIINSTVRFSWERITRKPKA